MQTQCYISSTSSSNVWIEKDLSRWEWKSVQATFARHLFCFIEVHFTFGFCNEVIADSFMTSTDYSRGSFFEFVKRMMRRKKAVRSAFYERLIFFGWGRDSVCVCVCWRVCVCVCVDVEGVGESKSCQLPKRKDLFLLKKKEFSINWFQFKYRPSSNMGFFSILFSLSLLLFSSLPT